VKASGLRRREVLFGGSAALFSFGRGPARANELVSLHGAGSTFSAPLYRTWIDAYKAEHPDILLSYDGVGSGEGMNRFVAGSVDFGASDVLPGADSFSGVKRGVVVVPVTAGMIVLAYNVPTLRVPLNLPRHVYSDIFSGRIQSWNDPAIQKANPNVALPPLDIAVVVRQDSSGTTAAFTRHLEAIGASWQATGAGQGFQIDWPAEVMFASGNEGVASKIRISEGSIGFVEYGFAKRLGLTMAVLENRAGRLVAPTEEAGRAALMATRNDSTDDPPGETSYPLVSYSWLLLNKKYWDPKRGPALKEWIRWGLTTGQTYAATLGYLRLPSEIALSAAQSLDAIT
jgi:phosphate transport system substrate-binding protein